MYRVHMGLPHFNRFLDGLESAANSFGRGADVQGSHYGAQSLAGGPSRCKWAALFVQAHRLSEITDH